MSAPAERSAWTRSYAWPFLGLFALNVVAFLVFTLPRSIQERRMAAEGLSLRQAIAAKRDEIANIRRRTDVVKANNKDVGEFFGETVHNCGETRIAALEHMHTMANQLGILAPRLGETEEDVKGLPLKKLPIAMPMAGTYQQLGKILQQVESSPQFLVVETVALHEQKAQGVGGADLAARVVAYCASGETTKPGRKRPPR
jgi:Tfp pilus assembly protein PilO